MSFACPSVWSIHLSAKCANTYNIRKEADYCSWPSIIVLVYQPCACMSPNLSVHLSRLHLVHLPQLAALCLAVHLLPVYPHVLFWSVFLPKVCQSLLPYAAMFRLPDCASTLPKEVYVFLLIKMSIWNWPVAKWEFQALWSLTCLDYWLSVSQHLPVYWASQPVYLWVQSPSHHARTVHACKCPMQLINKQIRQFLNMKWHTSFLGFSPAIQPAELSKQGMLAVETW